MTRILIIENNSLDPHGLRANSRRSRVHVLYEAACTSADVLRLLAPSRVAGPAMIVAPLEGLPGMPAALIAQHAREAHLPLILVGGDNAAERTQLAELRGLYAISCRRSRLPWLPLLIERTLNDFAAQLAQPSDLTPQCPAEQMREIQKLVTIGQLAGSIAHEINNPLEAITNLVYIVGSDPSLPADLRAYLDLAQQELGRVAQISKQTLSFYRESQTPVRVALSSLLDEVLVLYARRLDEKGIEVTHRYESEAPVLVYPGEMRQVYANLLANAIDATPEHGRIAVRIHLGRRWNPGRVSSDAPQPRGSAVEGVRVLVADSGAGIPREVRTHLGQPFYTTKGQRGTGLGLWVSQSILKRYGGAMKLRSSTALGRSGTTFSIFVPLETASHIVELPPSRRASRGSDDNSLRLCANGD